MPIARGLIREGKWSARENSWPRVETTFTEPLTNAYYDWAADGLPTGVLKEWVSLNRSDKLTADTADGPLVVSSGGMRAVRFDGTDDRMRLAFSDVPAGHFVVAVYRFVTYDMGDAVFYGYGDSTGGAITTNPNLDTVSVYAGAYLAPSPNIPGDTKWHITMMNNDSANSAFRHDAKEFTGTLPTVARQGITLGYSSQGADKGGTNRANIEYRRVAIMPPQTALERAALYVKLKAQYEL